VTAAPRIETIDCGRCLMPLAEAVAPGLFRVAGVTVRTKRCVELICPRCGFTNRWQGRPAVDQQDVEYLKSLDIPKPDVQDT
jgi:RNase P subunit RPR2